MDNTWFKYSCKEASELESKSKITFKIINCNMALKNVNHKHLTSKRGKTCAHKSPSTCRYCTQYDWHTANASTVRGMILVYNLTEFEKESLTITNIIFFVLKTFLQVWVFEIFWKKKICRPKSNKSGLLLGGKWIYILYRCFFKLPFYCLNRKNNASVGKTWGSSSVNTLVNM